MENLNEFENKIIQENKIEEEKNQKSKMNLRKQKKRLNYYEGKTIITKGKKILILIF